MAENNQFRLSAVLSGHESDVRSICQSPQAGVVTASRDKLAKLWYPDQQGIYRQSMTYVGHKDYINSMCVMPPSNEYPDGKLSKC